MKQGTENTQLHSKGWKRLLRHWGGQDAQPMSQDRLHNLSCSRESPGMSCGVGRALRAEQNSVLT